jgi:hypothetical protein
MHLTATAIYFFAVADMLAAAASASAATLIVGPGQRYTSIAVAIAASHDGDTVEVLAGTYVNESAEITTKITLTAVGGMVRMMSTGFIPNEKGILITDTNVTINGFEFTGARVTEADGGNGAGIRYQGGRLTINNCYFVNNQNGILGNPDPSGTVTITNSEFYHNGAASGASAGYTHNIYIGQIARFDIENSYSHDASVGHEVKSRAMVNIINHNRIVDGPTGTASYSIDLPNGGVATITNNQIEQGPASQNPIIISIGEEGPYANSALTLKGNLIENDLNSSEAIGIVNDTTAVARIINTSTYGLPTAQFSLGPADVSGTIMLAREPPISTAHPWAH